MKATAIILKNYPNLFPTIDDVASVDITLDSCSSGMVLIRLQFLSVDPYMRNRLKPKSTGYIDPLHLGKPIISMGIGEVIESQTERFSIGDLIIGMLPWQEYSVIDANTIHHLHNNKLPITAQLSILGYPGLTAYVGVHHIAQPKPQQTFFVSGAAGAVGSLAGQLAKLAGCTVVACAGSDEKVDYLLNDLHFDDAFNYHDYTHDYQSALKKYCPNGIDIDFENVGGALLENVIEHLNPHATVVLCGAIAQYNTQTPLQGPRNFNQVIAKKAKLIGYIVTDYDHLFDEFQAYIIQHYQAGNITYRETIVNGLDNAWPAFMGLFEGKNIGKMLVKI